MNRHQSQAVRVEGELELVFGSEEPGETADAHLAEAFHEANPEILNGLIRSIRPYKHLDKLSFRLFWETIRLEQRRHGGVKLPNNFGPWYSRKVMATVPGWDGMFRTIDRDES